MGQQIRQWSPSRLKLWESCPARAKYKVLDRLPDPAGPAAARGTFWHSVLEHDLTGQPRPQTDFPSDMLPLPAIIRDHWPLLDEIRKYQPKCEWQLGITREWKLTGFMFEDTWGRVVYDVAYPVELASGAQVATIKDWKSGKPRTDHLDQLQIYAATALIAFPEAVSAVATHHYIDQGPNNTMELIMDRSEQPRVLKQWEERIAKMEADTEFAPKPSRGKCEYCPYSARKNGPCAY